jgi:hypothetical protein
MPYDQLPRPCLVQKILGQQRAAPDEVDDIRRPRMRHVATFEPITRAPRSLTLSVGSWATSSDRTHRVQDAVGT